MTSAVRANGLYFYARSVTQVHRKRERNAPLVPWAEMELCRSRLLDEMLLAGQDKGASGTGIEGCEPKDGISKQQ
jgi:hypothetical protein